MLARGRVAHPFEQTGKSLQPYRPRYVDKAQMPTAIASNSSSRRFFGGRTINLGTIMAIDFLSARPFPVTASFTVPGECSVTGIPASPAAESTAPLASATPRAVFLFVLKKSVSSARKSGAYIRIASATALCTTARRSSAVPLGGMTQSLHIWVGREGSPSSTANPSLSNPGSIASTLIVIRASSRTRAHSYIPAAHPHGHRIAQGWHQAQSHLFRRDP